MAKHPGGRSTPKLTAEQLQAVCKALLSGMPRYAACCVAGLPMASFYNYMKKGQEAKDSGDATPYSRGVVEIVDAIEKAEAQAIQRNIAHIQIAAKTSWQAAAWWLERRYPEQFARRERHDITGDSDIRVTVKYADPKWGEGNNGNGRNGNAAKAAPRPTARN